MSSIERFKEIERALTSADVEIQVLTRKKAELEDTMQTILTDAGVADVAAFEVKTAGWDAKIESALLKLETEAKSLNLI